MPSFRDQWIPRLFMVSLVPSIVMLLALIFYPTSDLAKCPFLVSTNHFPANNSSLSPSFDSLLSITIQGHIFEINNSSVFTQPLEERDGSRLVFLGIVFNVSSGIVFYGGPNGAYYNLTRDGIDVTRALLVSSLAEENLNDRIEDFEDSILGNRLMQWLPFYLNKYPQVGVVEGKFFTNSGTPTEDWNKVMTLLSSLSATTESQTSLPQTTTDCIPSDIKAVSCSQSNHRPKILRHRGKSRCVCGIEQELFSVKSLIFTIVHFENCNEESTVCWPRSYEV